MKLSQDTKNIPGLQLPTDPRWVNLAEKSLFAPLTSITEANQWRKTFTGDGIEEIVISG
jgi:hypothetical protein